MPFQANDRVRVSNQGSQYRNHLGSVARMGGGAGAAQDVFVLIDGHERNGEVLFKAGDLQASTKPCPVTY